MFQTGRNAFDVKRSGLRASVKLLVFVHYITGPVISTWYIVTNTFNFRPHAALEVRGTERDSLIQGSIPFFVPWGVTRP